MSWSQVTFSAWVKSAIDAVRSTVRVPVVSRVAAFWSSATLPSYEHDKNCGSDKAGRRAENEGISPAKSLGTAENNR